MVDAELPDTSEKAQNFTDNKGQVLLTVSKKTFKHREHQSVFLKENGSWVSYLFHFFSKYKMSQTPRPNTIKIWWAWGPVVTEEAILSSNHFWFAELSTWLVSYMMDCTLNWWGRPWRNYLQKNSQIVMHMMPEKSVIDKRNTII